MKPLTALVFILALGSVCCNYMDPIKEACLKQEGITNEDRRNFKENEMKIKCYHHCVFEKNGIIVNGSYVGTNNRCFHIKDANKCELGFKVHMCIMWKG